MTENNGKLTDPRPALPANWLDAPAFGEFNQYDRTFSHQVLQNLEALGTEKANKLLNFLAEERRFKL